MPAGRPSDYRPEYCEAVEADMAAGYSLTAFAGGIGVAKSTVNLWINTYPEFSDAVSRAKALRLRKWEGSGLGIADGKGNSAAATIVVFGLKNMGGDEWAAPAEIRHTGDANNPVAMRIERVIVDPRA